MIPTYALKLMNAFAWIIMVTKSNSKDNEGCGKALALNFPDGVQSAFHGLYSCSCFWKWAFIYLNPHSNLILCLLALENLSD